MDDYEDMLANAKAIILSAPKGFRAVPGQSQVGITYIPPLNTDIRFAVGKFQLAKPRFSVSQQEQFPKQWQNFSNDKDSKKEFRLSTRPQNQGGCGSCFAFAVATVMNDAFVFGQGLTYNPMLSPMYILTCMRGDKCGGGNPSLVIDDIIEKGLATNCCMNYDKLCLGNSVCNTDPQKHFENKNGSINDMFPANCGCCQDSSNSKVYHLQPNKELVYEKGDGSGIALIKQHIMQYGAAIGAFIVFSTFISDQAHKGTTGGKFFETKGIYIKEEKSYMDVCNGNSDKIPAHCYGQPKPAIMGGHAIAIVGWGMEDEVTVNGNIYKNVAYWICRNSWGTEWGYGGYFKYAMFRPADKDLGLPALNENVGFETDNLYGPAHIGGVLLIKPGAIEDDTLPTTTCSETYKCDPIVYAKDISVKSKVDMNDTELKKKFFIGIVAFIALYFIIVFLRR